MPCRLDLSQVAVVLVEPQGPLNIGSVCRAMANFGVSDLRLVKPEADHLCDEARRMAVKATPILEAAPVFSSLAEALVDCHFSLAITRRFGKYREDFWHPEQAAAEVLALSEKGRVALVFGREDHGLFTSEIDLCQRLITIPTHERLRSLNLSQAVGICLFELYRAASFPRQAVVADSRRLAPAGELEAMFQHLRQCLLDIDYLDRQNPEHILRAYRRILGRAQLNQREVRILQGLWSRIDWLNRQRPA